MAITRTSKTTKKATASVSGQNNSEVGLAIKFKTAIADLVTDLTGSKTPTRTSIRNEQKLVAEILKENNKLLQRMREIKFKSKKIPQEKLIKDQQKALVLMVRLDTSHMDSDVEVSQIPDVRAMDQVMYKLCDELEKAYLDGDELTAHYIMETLTYGIATGHRPLRDMEKDREAEVMEKREKKMETYLRLTQAAQNVFQCTSSVDVQTAALKQNGEDLKKLLKEIEAFAQESGENAKAMEDIEKIGGKMNDLNGPLFELAQKYRSSVHIFNGCESLKKQVSLLKVKMEQYKSLINNMEITLNAPNEVAKTEIMNHAKELGQELMQRIDEQVKDIIQADAIITDYYNSVESVFQNPGLQKYISSALEQFEAMQLKMEEEQRAFERALSGAGRKKVIIPNETPVKKPDQTNEQEVEQEN